MKRCLIAYSSPFGQTKLISKAIAERLTDLGFHAECKSLEETHDFNYDLIVVGLPIYLSGFKKQAAKWLERHADQLNRTKFAFFSVSASAAGTDTKKLQALEQLVDKFLMQFDLRPLAVQNLAGAIHYRKYNFFVRWMMKRICAAEGGPTDTSQNHVLTDWNKVAEFASEVAQLVPDGAAIRQSKSEFESRTAD